MHIFLKKSCKIAAASGAPPSNPCWLEFPPPDLHVVSLAYWYSFFKYVSSFKVFYYKIWQKNNSKFLLLLLPRVWAYFCFKLYDFCWWGRKVL